MQLIESVASLVSNATGELEILIRVDEDDGSLAEDKSWQDWCSWRIIRGPRYGYQYLHRYYNELAGMAHGEWLMLWNDDAVMKTNGWDAILESFEPGLKILAMDEWCLFPVVHRSVFELLGHLSLNAHCDSWLDEVARQAGILISAPVKWQHVRTNDTTQLEAQEAMRTTNPEFFGDACQEKIKADARKIQAALQQRCA